MCVLGARISRNALASGFGGNRGLTPANAQRLILYCRPGPSWVAGSEGKKQEQYQFSRGGRHAERACYINAVDDVREGEAPAEP